jgi:hypothetical protein
MAGPENVAGKPGDSKVVFVGQPGRADDPDRLRAVTGQELGDFFRRLLKGFGPGDLLEIGTFADKRQGKAVETSQILKPVPAPVAEPAFTHGMESHRKTSEGLFAIRTDKHPASVAAEAANRRGVLNHLDNLNLFVTDSCDNEQISQKFRLLCLPKLVNAWRLGVNKETPNLFA